jgi:hypothetical protein
VYALRRVGLTAEASAFLGWVLDTVEPEQRPQVLYDIDGRQPVPERTDEHLEGYRGSQPVRWGNAAADQRQHDVFGELLDCAYQWAQWGGAIDDRLWARLRGLVAAAGTEWADPDHGIWEVRTAGRPFTYSAALCQVALDRGARLAGRLGRHEDARRWHAAAERIRSAILERAWSPERIDALTRALVAIILFSSAYMAENVRGGLQAVPRGQYEAAQALGLSGWQTMSLIVLPQALRAVIPAIVGQSIGLFKDTSLVFIVGLTELLAVSQTITKQSDFLAQGLIVETLVFAAFVYWAGSYWMSRESQRLEQRLGVGVR